MRVVDGARLAEPWVQFPTGRHPDPQVWWCLAYNPSTPEVEAEGLEVQGHLGLYNKFKAIPRDVRPCLNKQTERRPAAG